MKNIHLIAIILVAVALVVGVAAVLMLNGNGNDQGGTDPVDPTPVDPTPSDPTADSNYVNKRVKTAVTGVSSRETAKADGRLWIVGNANLDDVLDEKDVEWVKKILDGKANEVIFNANLSEWSVDARMADADQDGDVDYDDILKIRSMIAATQNSAKQKIYYVDVDGAVNSMNFPAKTIVSTYEQNSKQLQTLHAMDMVVGCDNASANHVYAQAYLNGKVILDNSTRFDPSAETIMAANPDIIVTGTRQWYCNELEKALPENRSNMDVVRISSWEDNNVLAGTLTLGFMLCKNNEAKEYVEWADKWINLIADKVSKLSDDQIVKILVPRGEYDNWNITMNGPRSGKYETSLLAGAYNCIIDNLTSSSTNVVVTDEWVKSLSDLDYIVCIVYGGLTNAEMKGYTNASFYETAVDYWASMTEAYGTKVCVLDNLVGQGTSFVIGSVYMAKWFYPDLFDDMNPDAIFQEFMDKFLQYNFDVAAYQKEGGIAIGDVDTKSSYADKRVVDVVTNDPARETSPADGRLWIVGNANMDDTLDESDIDWIKMILDGKANEVVFNANLSEWSVAVRMADADQDGDVDYDDILKVRSMIAATQDSAKQKIYYVDVDGALNSMNFPAKTIVSTYEQNSKQLQTLHAMDMVIGCDNASANHVYAQSYLTGKVVLDNSTRFDPSAELMMSLSPDIIVTGTRQWYCNALEAALPANRANMDVVRISSWEDNNVLAGTLTLGFMFCKNEEAKAYVEWADRYLNTISEKVSQLSEDQIVKILVPRGEYDNWNITMNGPRSGKYETSLLAGAYNCIIENLTSSSTNVVVTDEWVKSLSDLDFIVCIVYGGLTNGVMKGYTNASFYDEAVTYWSSMTDAYGTKVCVLDNLVGQGTTFVIGSVYMAKWFYPDLFDDMDPDAIFQEFMDNFLQYDFDVAAYQANGGIAIGEGNASTYVNKRVTEAVTDDSNRETSPADGRLWIVGNANMDDNLDEQDVEWIKMILDGKANEVIFNANLSDWSVAVRMADADQDGDVDYDDILKVKSMIAATQDSAKQKIYYVDVDGAVNSMNFPAKTVVSTYEQNSKQLQTLHAMDMVVGCDNASANHIYAQSYLTGKVVLDNSTRFDPSAELMMSLNPDIIVTGTRQWYCNELEKALPENRTNMDVVRISSWEDNNVLAGTLTLGFMLCKNEEAKAYVEWADRYLNTISEKVSQLSEDEIVKILVPRGEYDKWNVTMNGPRSGKYETSLLAGAYNCIIDNLTSTSTNVVVTDEWVKSLSDLDYIVCIVYGGLTNAEMKGYTNSSFYDTAVEYWASMTEAYGTKVHVLDNMVGQGTTFVIGSVYMAKWFYPELFEDMDPDAIFQEFMDMFLQYDFDVAAYQANGGIAI